MDEDVVGRQVVCDCRECEGNIGSAEFLRTVLREVAEQSRVTLLEMFIHQFSPQGISATAVIAESHIFIHTWPEKRYVALDVFTCGDNALPELAVEVMRKAFRPQHVETRIIERSASARLSA